MTTIITQETKEGRKLKKIIRLVIGALFSVAKDWKQLKYTPM